MACSGLLINTRNRMAELITGWGYVALVVDSFITRGIKAVCDYFVPAATQGDALGALAYLSKLPFVDPRRVAVMGSSQGAASSRWSWPVLMPSIFLPFAVATEVQGRRGLLSPVRLCHPGVEYSNHCPDRRT